MMNEVNPAICNQVDCTYTQTGICVLNNEPTTCPDRLTSLVNYSSVEESISGDAILESPAELERFSSSFSLVVEDAEKLMRTRYCKVVGILGIPGTGKTASLASLYLLLAHGNLKGFQFMDSKSLRAFEEITGGTRRWNASNLPEQLTVHTEMQDERIAAYLHLRLKNLVDSVKLDLLLTDLPGEWTLTLIDENRTDRLTFLKSAERIWITINAEDIKNASLRRHTLHRTTLLIQRLVEYMGTAIPDLSIVLTHSDKSDSVTKYLSNLITSFSEIDIKVFEVASFSENPKILPGFGLDELVKDLLQARRTTTFDSATSLILNESVRNMLKFQNLK